MELIVLVAAPSLFLLFFPEPTVAFAICVVAAIRLCQIFTAQFRAQREQHVETWSIIGAAIIIIIAVFIDVERLRDALIYLSITLAARFVTSIIVCNEDHCATTFKSLQHLNDELQRELERMKSIHLQLILLKCNDEISAEHLNDTRRRLHSLERDYGERIQFWLSRLATLNAQQKLRLQAFETRREDVQQTLFDLYEEFDRLQSPSIPAIPTVNHIDAIEIRRKFDEALRSAECELDIFSPCMSFKLVRSLKPRLKELLDRSVSIKIRYSLGDADDSRHRITSKVAKMLRRDFKRYKNFDLYRDDECAKLFICDEKFCVHSSFNVLSYGGDVDGFDGGECSSDRAALRECRDKYFNFKGEDS